MSFQDYIDENYSYTCSAGQVKLEGECPFCHKSDDDLRLYIDMKKERGICHHCSTGFGPIKFIMASENMGFQQAQRFLKDDGNSYIRSEDEAVETALWWPQTVKISDSANAESYMTGRGMSRELADYFQVRFCNTNTSVDEKLHYTNDRIIIPIFDNNGNPAGWQGRDITGKAFVKYLFPSGFKAGDFLYNANNIPASSDYLIISEGVFDCWGWWRSGFKNVVGTFGKKMSDSQIDLLFEIMPKVVFIAWDSDAKLKKYEFAERFGHLFDVRIVDLEGRDADELKGAKLLDIFSSSKRYNWSDKIAL